MAASAYAGRNRSAPPRRRPAARKRRPAARSGASRVNWDRGGRTVLPPAIACVKTYPAPPAAKAQLHELQHENTRLHNRIQSAGDPLVIDRMAHAQGMVAEGETPVGVRGLGN